MEILQQIVKILIAIFMIIILAFLLAFPVMWLWNWLMPIIFTLPEITMLQAFGIMILCNLLFKNYISFSN